MRVHLSITYPDGRSFNGVRDFRKWPALLGLDKIDYHNLTALDVATDEGFWAFWAEQQGAKDVLAIDVEKAEDYDWGWTKDDAWCRDLNAHRAPLGKRVFDAHHTALDSKVRYEKASVYDVTGSFDVLFNCGLLYHLRHPLLAFDRCRKACTGFMLLETLIENRLGEYNPTCIFYPKMAPRGKEPSNWSGLSTGCVVAMLHDAGFNRVYATQDGFPHHMRQTFIAVVDPIYFSAFEQADGLRLLGPEYLSAVVDHASWGES